MAKEDQRQSIGTQKVKPGLTAFLYQGRTIVGVVEGGVGTIRLDNYTLVKKAIELKFQMTKDEAGNPGIGTSPFPLLPANEPVALWLPPCAHFDVSGDGNVIGVWELMTGESTLVAANGPLSALPPLPSLRR